MHAIPIEHAIQFALGHHQAGRLAEAEAIYRQILATAPRQPDALHGLGLIACATGHYYEAVRLMADAVALAPQQPGWHSNLAAALSRLGRFDEAVDRYRRAIALQPDCVEAHIGVSAALCALQRPEEAIASATHAVALRPDHPEAHNNLGKALFESGRRQDALASIERAIALSPENVEAGGNLGGVLVAEGRWDDAIARLLRVLAVKPDCSDALYNLACALTGKGDFVQALDVCQRAIARHPDSAVTHYGLAGLLLLLGRYEQGWREYEWRWKYSGFGGVRRNFPQPQWDGRRIPGRTILLHAEQGYGDILQFLRYVPFVRVRSDALRVFFECPPEMTRLLAFAADWDVQIVPMRGTGGKPLPHFDFQLPLLSLPWALRLPEPSNPAFPDGPYLRADETMRTFWRERLYPPGEPAARLRVGIVWAGRPTHMHDARRSIPLEKILPILRVPGVSFHSLQLASNPAQIETLREAGVPDHTAHLRDFADTAALIAELDLVITVDTAVAHLAGALGKPVWTFLPFVPDWRWGLEEEDTPWYPTMRLFRQQREGDWEPLISRVAEELGAMRR